jgi:hypothetical protein
MGFNVIDSTATNVKIKGVAASAITAGDLVGNSEIGKVFKVNEKLGISVTNNTVNGASAVVPITSIDATTGYDSSSLYSISRLCELENGNIAFVYSGDGATESTGLNLRIQNPFLVNVISKITLSSAASITTYRCFKLNPTQFVVFWNEAAVLKFAVVNNDGSIAINSTTVSTMSGWNCSRIDNGKFVVVYYKVTSNNCVFSIYNASGVLQGSETTIEASGSPANIAIKSCVNSDFVVSYYRSSATTAYKSARFTSAGVIVGSLTTLVTGGSTLSVGDYNNGLIELSNGNVVAVVPGADAYPDIRILNASNTLLTSIDLGSGSITGNEVHCLVPMDNGFAIFARGSTNAYMWLFDNNGSAILQKTQITGGLNGDGTTNGAIGSGITAFELKGIGFVLLRVGYSATPTYDAKLAVVNYQGAVIGSVINLIVSGSSIISGTSAILTKDGLFIGMFKYGTSTYLSNFCYNVYRRSILGVATEDVSENQPLNVLTKGTYTINQNFGMGGSFDNTITVVPGTKGTVVGNTAILRGTL